MSNTYKIWTFIDAPPQQISVEVLTYNTSLSEIHWGDGTLDVLPEVQSYTTLSHEYTGLNYNEGRTDSSTNHYLDNNYMRGSLQEFNKLI